MSSSSSPSPSTTPSPTPPTTTTSSHTELLDVDTISTTESQRDLTFMNDTFGNIFEDMGLDTLATEVFNPGTSSHAPPSTTTVHMNDPKPSHQQREMTSPNGNDARFLHPDIENEFMAPSPSKITSTPHKRSIPKSETPAGHKLISLITSPQEFISPLSKNPKSSQKLIPSRSHFLSTTGNKLIHAASPSQQILADVTRKHARSSPNDNISNKRRRVDGTIPFAVIKPPTVVDHYHPPPLTVNVFQHSTRLFPNTKPTTSTISTLIKQEPESDEDDDDDDQSTRTNKKSNKKDRTAQQKGLRHFSLKVCEKVEQQQVTTYNKVADELVIELTDPTKSVGLGTGKKSYDEKNIRRRVYDALNVLMAMGIIEKEKKKITWIGLPGGGMGMEDVIALHQEKIARMERLEKKRRLLAQLLTQQVCVRRILQRNAAHPSEIRNHDSSMKFPFVVIECPIDVTVNTAMTPARDAMEMTFSDSFRVHEHSDILEKMSLPYVTTQDLPHLIPREMVPFYPAEWITKEKKTCWYWCKTRTMKGEMMCSSS